MTNTKNQRSAVELILADESLTADLVDDAAALLLDWGLTRAKALTQKTEPASHLASLRHTMKCIGRRAGKAHPGIQAERVRALLAEAEANQGDENETSDV